MRSDISLLNLFDDALLKILEPLGHLSRITAMNFLRYRDAFMLAVTSHCVLDLFMRRVEHFELILECKQIKYTVSPYYATLVRVPMCCPLYSIHTWPWCPFHCVAYPQHICFLLIVPSRAWQSRPNTSRKQVSSAFDSCSCSLLQLASPTLYCRCTSML